MQKELALQLPSPKVKIKNIQGKTIKTWQNAQVKRVLEQDGDQ